MADVFVMHETSEACKQWCANNRKAGAKKDLTVFQLKDREGHVIGFHGAINSNQSLAAWSRSTLGVTARKAERQSRSVLERVDDMTDDQLSQLEQILAKRRAALASANGQPVAPAAPAAPVAPVATMKPAMEVIKNAGNSGSKHGQHGKR